MTVDAWDRVADYAVGTCDSPAVLAERFEVPEDEVEEQLGKRRVETCPGCGWWWMAIELDGEGYCPDCR